MWNVGWVECRVGGAKRNPPSAEMVGSASLHPPYIFLIFLAKTGFFKKKTVSNASSHFAISKKSLTYWKMAVSRLAYFKVFI